MQPRSDSDVMVGDVTAPASLDPLVCQLTAALAHCVLTTMCQHAHQPSNSFSVRQQIIERERNVNLCAQK